MSPETQATTSQTSELIETYFRVYGQIGIVLWSVAMLTMFVCSYWFIDARMREPKAPSVFKLLPPLVRRLYIYSLSYMFGFMILTVVILGVLRLFGISLKK